MKVLGRAARGMVVGAMAAALVAPALAAKGGWYTRWDRAFVGMLGAAGFFVGFGVAMRLTSKPRRETRAWIVSVGQALPAAQSYREQRLHHRGEYRVAQKSAPVRLRRAGNASLTAPATPEGPE